MTKPLVHWVAPGVEGSKQTGFTSSFASTRYRAIGPARGLETAGFSIDVVDASRWSWPPDVRPSAVIVGKIAALSTDADRAASLRLVMDRVLGSAKAAVSDRVPLVADFSDDWFDDPVRGPYMTQLAQLADLCVAGSIEMEAVLRRVCSKATMVIGDVLGSPAGRPVVFRRDPWIARALGKVLPGRPYSPLRFAWYGHHSNWPPMNDWALRLATLRHKQPFLISLVSAPSRLIEEGIAQFNARYAPHALMELVPWSESEQWRTVTESHIVLVPTKTDVTSKRVKTSNRVSDALNAGRYVIASPLPAYEHFSPAVPLVDDPVDAVRHYLAGPESALRAIERGQALAIKDGSVDVISALWRRAILRAMAAAGAPPPCDSPDRQSSDNQRAPIRLNLGCGDKILEGFVNVDVVESRAGKSPDVICDLRALTPFPDSHADEILAVHVVEHFWRWEVESVLREWVRVLKPGGRMVLECPNLIAACEEFLSDPDRGSQPDAAGQRTMWVFYGDPRWEDPLMVHRWGYTPRSLAALMQHCGLVNARQEPAQFKLREPRDMRIVAEKPQ